MPVSGFLKMSFMKSKFPSRVIFDFPLFRGGVEDFLSVLFSESRPQCVAYLNAHTVNLAHSEPNFRRTLQQMDLLYADGMSLVKTAAKVGRPIEERINAGDFFTRFLWKCVTSEATVAFVGSANGVAEKAAAELQKNLPQSPIQFTHHGYFFASASQKETLLKQLKTVNPKYLLLGLGSPIQEELALEWAVELPETTIWCVGALFEYSAGRKRAPAWVREIGAEWVVRLCLEPGRLWRRYLIGNAKYLYHEYCWRKNL